MKNKINAVNFYFIEVTDMYGGETNYSWVTRHVIKAKTLKGAKQRFSMMSGINWHYDGLKMVSKSGATCYFIDWYDEEGHSDYSFSTDERE